MQATKVYSAGDNLKTSALVSVDKDTDICWKLSTRTRTRTRTSGFTRQRRARRARAMQSKLQCHETLETSSTCERGASAGDTLSEVSLNRSSEDGPRDQRLRHLELHRLASAEPAIEILCPTLDGSEHGPRSRHRSHAWDFFEDACSSEASPNADTAVPEVTTLAVHQNGASPEPLPKPQVCVLFTGWVPVLLPWPGQCPLAIQQDSSSAVSCTSPTAIHLTGGQASNACSVNFAPLGAPNLVPCDFTAPTQATTQAPCAAPTLPSQKTTLIIRHIPCNHEPTDVLALLDSYGFAGCYNFFYLPRDGKSLAALGYAFVNFVSPEVAVRAFAAFDNMYGSKVQWCPYQGFTQLVEAARCCPVMRKSVADKFKPFVFQNGVRVAFQ